MRQRLFKSLRIAVTAVSLLVCGVLLVLWVRSYSHRESVIGRISSSRHFYARSGPSYVQIALIPSAPNYKNDWTIVRFAKSNNYSPEPWYYHWDQRLGLVLRSPHWFPITIFSIIAALPWIKWRFSLRTLLIALTLFAVFFGAIAMTL